MPAAAKPRRARKPPVAPSKGERTAQRILDVAEALFAERGFEGTSLRAIAAGAGLREPSLYRHFDGKRRLYAAVLDRALAPMAEALRAHAAGSAPERGRDALAGVMTDLLLEHPRVAALFQQALQGDPDSVGTRLIRRWLDRLFRQALDVLQAAGPGRHDRADLAIQVIAMFNLTTGYFLSQRALASMVGGHITDPAHVARQKKLLARVVRAMRG
jgi:AcrR family transcriptional regulator